MKNVKKNNEKKHKPNRLKFDSEDSAVNNFQCVEITDYLPI